MITKVCLRIDLTFRC